MSSNRLIYDTCAYKHDLVQSVGPLEYMLNPIKFENANKCRMELGLLGGTAVSHVKGNLVDLETDLRGQTRRTTKCPSKLYQNPCPQGIHRTPVTVLLNMYQFTTSYLSLAHHSSNAQSLLPSVVTEP